MSSTSTSSSDVNKESSFYCCPRGTCSRCCSCLTKFCQSCCPYLDFGGKDRYAAIEYQPIVPSTPSHQSIFAARKSLSSMPAKYLPHQSESIDSDDEYDYENPVVTEEPQPLSSVRHSISDYSAGEHSSRTKSGRDIRGSPDELSSYESEEGEMGVMVGFVDYERTERRDSHDIRICRTPEVELEQESNQSDSPSDFDPEDCQLAIRCQAEDVPASADLLSLRRRSEQVLRSASPHRPCMNFSLYFDDKRNILIVHLLKAFHLPTRRAESASNPFAEVYLLPHKGEAHESRVLQRTLDPIFDQPFNFVNMSIDEIRKQMLVIRIYLHTKHHFIGGILFSLEKANLFGNSNNVDLTAFDEEEGLKEKSSGDVLLSITYHPEAGTLEIFIWEVSHLKKQDLIGLPNPYVKVNLFSKGERLSKWRSSTLKNTLNPVFNELCVLDIGSLDIENLQVEVVVMDYDWFGRNNELGSVMFGSNMSVDQSGKIHWEDVISKPNVCHMCWHVITLSESSTLRGLRSPARSKRSPASCVTTTGK